MYAANQSLARNLKELGPEELILKMKLKDLERLSKNISTLEKEIEPLLLETDGKLLLTTPGIGLVTAAELYSEIGDVSQYDNPNQIIKKAGTNPIMKQSGGGQGYFGRISKQGNPHLRYIIYNVWRSLSMHNKDLLPFVERLKEKRKAFKKGIYRTGK